MTDLFSMSAFAILDSPWLFVAPDATAGQKSVYGCIARRWLSSLCAWG